MNKIVCLILLANLAFQPMVSYAETASDKAALLQLEQLQANMAKRTQLAEASDPRLDIFRAAGAAAGGTPPATATPPAAATTPSVAPTTPASPPALPTITPSANATPPSEFLAPGETSSALDEAAFRQVIRNILPLQPEHIVKLRKAYVDEKQASQAPVTVPPKPVATTQSINLAPGATPPVIRLAKGFVSSLVFIDTTGAPWPIESYDIGDPASFNIQWDKKSNTMMIQATKLYTYGNIAVKLWDLNTPIMMTLIPGQKAVDYRIDLRVPAAGPQAKSATVTTVAADGANTDLLSVLNGVPPPDVTEVKVEGGQAQAWFRGVTMYVRTDAQLLSPGWISSMKSADGMNAYELPVTSRLVMSVRGKIVQFKVEGL